MDWRAKDWTWAPRLDESIAWLCRNLPRAPVFPVYALFNLEHWNFPRIWGRLKAYASGYLVIIAAFAAPLWLDLVYSLRAYLFALFESGPQPDKDGVPDIRGHY